MDDTRIVAVNLGPLPCPPTVVLDKKKAQHAAPKSKKEQHGAVQITGDCGPLSIRVSRPCTKWGSRQVVFRLDPSAVQNITENELAAFASDDFDKLGDQSRLKKSLEAIAGRRRTSDITHLGSATVLEYLITDRKTFGVGPHDTMFFRNFDQTSLLMRLDFERRPFTGHQEPVISCTANDIINCGSGLILVGPVYPWPNQKMDWIPDENLKRLFYDSKLHGLIDDGTKLSDVLAIRTEVEYKNASLEIITGGSAHGLAAGIVLCGEDRELAVRVSMGISFRQDPRFLDEVWYGNPSLAVCHGYVESIEQGDGEIILTVRLALARDNFPSYLKLSRWRSDALLQTDLRWKVRPECVVSAQQFLPLALFNCPPEDKDQLGSPSQAFMGRNGYICGHIDFELGSFRNADGGIGHYGPAISIMGMLSCFCARGGPVTDQDFTAFHAEWKQEFIRKMYRTYGGLFLSKATLSAVDPFPPEQALPTISNCLQMRGDIAIDTHLKVIRAAFRRSLEARAKRMKQQQGNGFSFNSGIPGHALLRLVHLLVPGDDCKTVFQEGSVVVTVKDDDKVAAILGRVEVPLEGAGSVQVIGPYNFTLELYDPRKRDLDSAEGIGGVSVAGYVSKDRHGGQLTGALYEGAEGDAKGGGGGEVTRTKHSTGVWPEHSELYR